MIKMLTSTLRVLLKWLPLTVYIPMLSFMVTIITVLLLKHNVETLPSFKAFGIWLSSLITAYVFCLYNLLRNTNVSINNE